MNNVTTRNQGTYFLGNHENSKKHLFVPKKNNMDYSNYQGIWKSNDNKSQIRWLTRLHKKKKRFICESDFIFYSSPSQNFD